MGPRGSDFDDDEAIEEREHPPRGLAMPQLGPVRQCCVDKPGPGVWNRLLHPRRRHRHRHG